MNSSILGAIFAIFLIQCVHKENSKERSIASTTNNGSLQRYAYQKCQNERKNYLENDMVKMPEEFFTPHDREWSQSIPMKCIQLAQRNFSGHYAVCENDEAKPKVIENKPCLSEKYVHLAYNAFHDVMDCFSLDPKEFYLQIMIESGFHVNAINKTGFDSGIAQFTANGIKRVISNNRIERTRRVLLESSRASCQRISSIIGAFDITSFVVEKRCSMIALPNNPYRSMFFNYLHTMLDQIDLRRQIEDEFSSLGEYQNILTDKIKRQLLYMAYNRGITGIKKLLLGYLNNRKLMNVVVTEGDLDLNQNLSRAKKILSLEPHKRTTLKKAKIKNLSFAEYAVINNATYVADIVAAQDYVRRHLGDECSRF